MPAHVVSGAPSFGGQVLGSELGNPHFFTLAKVFDIAAHREAAAHGLNALPSHF